MSRRIDFPKARLSPAKDGLVAVEFARRHIESGDIAEILNKLSPMCATRDKAQSFEGRMTFYFSGWDDDPRETAAIPEIRAWFAKLTTGGFPYWLHFLEKQGDSVLHAMRLLCTGHYEKGPVSGMVGWSFDDLEEFKRTLLTLFCHMNEMYDRLGLPEGMNERVSEEVTQLIVCSFE